MSEPPESLEEALEDHDITLALTPGQVLVFLIGLYLLLRFLRGLRG